MKKRLPISILALLGLGFAPCLADDASSLAADPVVQTLDKELTRSMTRLKNAEKAAPLYYLAYRLYEGQWEKITATDGALQDREPGNKWRMLGVELRVGSPHLDNTHYLRSEHTRAQAVFDRSTKPSSILPGSGAGIPLQECLWLKTDEAFKQAQDRYQELLASQDVLSAEEDKSGDFSSQPARKYYETKEASKIDREQWEDRVKRLSKLFLNHPKIQKSEVAFNAQPSVRYIVNSEGSQIVEPHLSYMVYAKASTQTEDGVTLALSDTIISEDAKSLENEKALTERIEKLAKSLEQLRDAPAAESYVGPAILSGRAAAVFFHETFGHRVESVHEKSESEGKTFAKKIGTAVMPSFITVIDDPTASSFNGEYLHGHYKYDDEGVPAQSVTLAKKGILTGLLLGRTLVQGFDASNGHGRSSPGWNPVARQSNLRVIAEKNKQVAPDALRALLIKEAKKQKKTYGLYFEEISGGSTGTDARSEQMYNVYPLLVYKVFVDGRPDELIKGANIVGTPLSALERITAASTEYGVFNGSCGRDSGPVPVSAVSPGLLIQSIEIKRAAKSFQKPPILPDPTQEGKPAEAGK